MSSTLIKLNPVVSRIIFILCIIACAVFPIDPPLALAMGIAMAIVMGNPFAAINHKAVQILIQISVIGLGFGVNLFHAYEAGKQGLIFTVTTIIMTFIAGYITGKLLKVDSKTSLLISNGTAVCGGSAIAAVAPIIDADEKQLSVSLGTILILNSVALLIFPLIGHYLNLSETQFGTWCAIAIHDTSSVVGASSKYGELALQVAATIKLERALWIIPIALITAWVQKRHGIKIKIPYFIFFYILAMIIATYFPRPEFSTVFFVARKGLVIVLFLIGAGLSMDRIKTVGWKPFVQGIILWFLISIVSLIVIMNTIG